MANWDILKVQPDQTALARYTAERIVRIINATLDMNDHFSLALSGGSTPEPVYALLGTDYAIYLDWSRIHIFWGDERHSPPDNPQSNYGMVKRTLIDHIDIPTDNVHRIKAEWDAEKAARAYEDELRAFFKADEQLFDLNLLGMGDDGHTASLFPHTKAIHETDKWVIAHHVDQLGAQRITLSQTAILASSNIMFLIAGASKADALYEVLEGDYQPDEYPAQVIARSQHAHIIWAVDKQASAKLPD
jgi:6-phosphogluconolactonase